MCFNEGVALASSPRRRVYRLRARECIRDVPELLLLLLVLLLLWRETHIIFTDV